MSDTEGPHVVDEPEHNRFAWYENGIRAELLYQRRGSRLTLIHTGVPDELGGHGVGARLVRAAVESASKDGLILEPWCPFARQWLLQHRDVAEGIEIDWSSRPDIRNAGFAP